jgi:hypothetical protein
LAKSEADEAATAMITGHQTPFKLAAQLAFAMFCTQESHAAFTHPFPSQRPFKLSAYLPSITPAPSPALVPHGGRRQLPHCSS